MIDKTKQVVELIKLAKPRNVCVLLEVPADHTFDDTKINGWNVQRLDDALGDVEEGAINPSIPVTTHLVIKCPVKEGDTRILPKYAFFDRKIKLRRVLAYDIVIIKTLDNNHLVVKAPEGIDLLPFAKLD